MFPAVLKQKKSMQKLAQNKGSPTKFAPRIKRIK